MPCDCFANKYCQYVLYFGYGATEVAFTLFFDLVCTPSRLLGVELSRRTNFEQFFDRHSTTNASSSSSSMSASASVAHQSSSSSVTAAAATMHDLRAMGSSSSLASNESVPSPRRRRPSAAYVALRHQCSCRCSGWHWFGDMARDSKPRSSRSAHARVFM